MKKFLSDGIPFAKIMTFLAVSLAISLGLCGVGIAASGSANLSGLRGAIVNGTHLVGMVAFWLSALGLIVGLILFVILRLWDEARFRKSK